MDQREITRPAPLLDSRGEPLQPGYARRMLPQYRRSMVKGGALRKKEWDYYLVCCGAFALALTVADNDYMGMDSISLLDFREGWEVTRSPIQLLTLGRKKLPESSLAGDTASHGRGYGLCFRNHGDGRRTLAAHMAAFGRGGEPLRARVELRETLPESMVICTPFAKKGHFYFNQKINCLAASGEVELGRRRYVFPEGESFAVLDWGRGVWTYDNTWYWASLSGRDCRGENVGLNLGCGFGDTAAATENMVFSGGRAHKLGRVAFHIPRWRGKEDYMAPWGFTSDDGRLRLELRPVLDRAARAGAGPLISDQHQVFGRFSGTVTLDDGSVLELRDQMGFAEKVRNKW